LLGYEGERGMMDERYRYLISEWEEGGTLEDHLKRLDAAGKFLSKKQVLNYFTMILLAVEQTHNQGMLHGNISSSHIYFKENRGITITVLSN